jgi:MFS family permease
MSLATAAFVVAGMWLAPVLLAMLTVCGRGSAGVLGAIIGRTVEKQRRVRYRAIVKSVSNAMMVVGIGLGAIVLAEGSRRAFQLGFVVEAVMFVVAGLLVRCAGSTSGLTAPPREPVTEDGGTAARSRWAVLRDRRFAALTAVNCLLSLPEPMLTIGLPLWVSAQMHAPLWVVSVALVVHTAGIVLLQIPAARGVSDVPTAARLGRRAALLFAVAAAMFPLGAVTDAALAATAVVAAIALAQVGGEVCYAAASWGLLYGLAPDRSLGQYQGVYNVGFDVAMMVGPVLFGWLAATGSRAGWAVLAGAYVTAALLVTRISTGQWTAARAT